MTFVWTTTTRALCTLPESPFPGLSLSDLPLPAAAAAAFQFVLFGGVDHDNNDVDDDGGGCFDVHSAIITSVLDGKWDENGYFFIHRKRKKGVRWNEERNGLQVF